MTSPADRPLALSPCPVCGFDHEATTIDDALRIVHEGVPVVRTRFHLAGASTRLRHRPASSVWSPLEYGAHLQRR